MRKIACLLIILLFFLSSIGLTVSNKNTNYETSDIPFQDGWPRETTGEIHSSPVTADLDNDGTKEIIVGSGFFGDSHFKLYVFHSDGTNMDGWPVRLEDVAHMSPAVGDLDNDGDLEIVINDGNYWGHVYAFQHDGTMMDGWPKSISDMNSIGEMSSSPTLYDIDKDGDLEVIVGSTQFLKDSTGMFAKVNIWHHDGTDVDGWPKLITDYSDSYNFHSSAAVGDIDNDGDVEIIVGITAPSKNTNEGFIYAWHHNGQLVDGWPVSVGKPNDADTCPILGDLDGDKDLEIIFGTGNRKILALHHDGSNVSGWPNYGWITGITGQALADIDQDAKFEIIAGIYQGYLYVWNDDGSLIDGWPQYASGWVQYPPIIGDVAGDEHLEIISPSNSQYGKSLHAWYYNGTKVPGFPLQTGGVVVSTPCMDDIDGDGDVELIIGSTDKKLYVWDLSHPYKENLAEWPMFQHDSYHTGEFSFGRGFVADTNGPYYNRINNENVFIGSVLNGNPPFKWFWDFGDGNSSNEQNPTHVYTTVGDYLVNLTITDALGNKAYDTCLINISLFGRDESGALRVSIKGGFGLTLVIENMGTVDANGIEWSLNIDDNLINWDIILAFPKDGKKTGIIDIPAGESRNIWIFILRKLGDDLQSFITYSWIDFYINFSAKIMDCIASDYMEANIKGLVFVV